MRSKELKKDQGFVERGGEYSDGESLGEEDEAGDDDDFEDESDEDDDFYDDDTTMYKSRIEDIDELKTLKESIEHVYTSNQPLY